MSECTTCGDKITTTTSCQEISAACVIYKPKTSLLTCLDIPINTNVEKILETLDDVLCSILNIPIISCVKEKLNISEDILTQVNLLNAIQEWICNYSDQNVKITPSDATSGFLDDKIILGDCLEKTIIVDDNGNQQLKISLDFTCIANRIPTCFEIQTPSCVTVDCTPCGGTCTPQPTLPVITRINSVLTGSNCNGLIEWFNSNDSLIATGNTYIGESNEKYYAKCSTRCGESASSNTITIPNIITYTNTRTARFVRNNCGVNSCNIPCIGTSITFTKTYTSIISQENVDSQAENDDNFPIDGQNYANTTGACNCSECNCVFPGYNNNIIKTNPTCSGSVISATGSVLIAGITNANKFGYFIGSGNYGGVSYENAITLNNYNQANIETTPSTIRIKSLSIETRIVVRIFNNNASCYTDVVVSLTPPDCTQEQVEIQDPSVSCEVDVPICKNWSIATGSNGGYLYFLPCNSTVYMPETLAANITIQRCSTIVPQATGAVVTENGLCS